jgi:hypothetical protein
VVRRRKSGKDIDGCESIVGIVIGVIVVTFCVFTTDGSKMGGTRQRRATSTVEKRLRSYLHVIVFETT